MAIGPISGAHFNPAVTLVDAWQQGVAWADVPVLIVAQIFGGLAGLTPSLPAVAESNR